MMIRAIFRDKKMIAFSTLGYFSDNPDEVVVEMTEEQLKELIGLDDWQELFLTVELDNEDSKIAANVQPSRGNSKVLSSEISKPIFRLRENLTEEELRNVLGKYLSYEVDKAYSSGNKFVYRSKLYKVVQSHTSQVSWQPDLTPALYTEVMPEAVIGPWRQPLGAHDAYRIGDRVTFNSQVYVCTSDYNVYAPDVTGWALEESGDEEFPEWVQPLGAHDAYALGDVVSHNGQLWISIVASNVWEPGIYGWGLYEE